MRLNVQQRSRTTRERFYDKTKSTNIKKSYLKMFSKGEVLQDEEKNRNYPKHYCFVFCSLLSAFNTIMSF